MRKLSWQLKILILFISIWALFNIENILVKLVEIVVLSPLHINSFLNNTLGNEVWANIVSILSHPLLLLLLSVLVSALLIKIIQVIDGALED